MFDGKKKILFHLYKDRYKIYKKKKFKSFVFFPIYLLKYWGIRKSEDQIMLLLAVIAEFYINLFLPFIHELDSDWLTLDF